MAGVFISLGSNLGDRWMMLGDARRRLQRGGTLRLTACSPVYESEPWGPVEQPPYLNQVCRGETALAPLELLELLQAVERQAGRDRSRERRWGPRPLDLDLLVYDDLVLDDPVLTLPHPRLPERRFVLRPLADIAPWWHHPVSGQSAADLLAVTSDAGELWPASPLDDGNQADENEGG